MDKEAVLEKQIAKEAYVLFKDYYDKSSWRSYCSWDDLSDESKEFWFDLVTVVGLKVISNIK